MNVKVIIATLAASGWLATTSASHAYILRIYIVERVGDQDFVIPEGRLVVVPGSSHRFRLMMEFIPENGDTVDIGGWFGKITTTGGTNFRTGHPSPNDPRGRIPPFVRGNSGGGEGLPAQDPFVSLTNVEPFLGIRQWTWNCNPDGTIPPRPLIEIPPQPFGVPLPTYEITSIAGEVSYVIEFAGSAAPIREWRINNHCFLGGKPFCGDPDDPSDDYPLYCHAIPFPHEYVPFTRAVNIVVCAAEWNHSGRLDSQDLFDFVADYFDFAADFNGDGVTDSRDFFEYLAVFLQPCV